MANEKTHLLFIVDDDELYIKVLEKHLSTQKKFRIQCFTDGENCLENMHLKPDVVFLDYNLNGNKSSAQNGVEILKKIKLINKQIIVIVLSAQDSIDVAVSSIKYGASDYVIKNETSLIRIQQVCKHAYNHIKLRNVVKAFRYAVFAAGIIGLMVAIGLVFIYFIK